MDERIWLEEVEGERALDWVRGRSAAAERVLQEDPGYQRRFDGILEVLEAPDRLPLVAQAGDYLYNFWADAGHQRGIWRRTTWQSYRAEAPEWEILLDLDALSEADGIAWVWHGASVLRPDLDRALISLSPGGSDADITREFDLSALDWVAEGFERAESKGNLTWVDRDAVLVTTDVGPGSMTRSGYPRTIRLWRRGTDLADAPEIFAGEHEDLGVFAHHDSTPGYERTIISRALAFYKTQTLLIDSAPDQSSDSASGPAGDPSPAPVPVDVPESAIASVHRNWLAISLRHDWDVSATTYPAGALLVTDLAAFQRGEREFHLAFVPDESSALEDWTWTRNYLVTTVLRNVQHVLTVHHHDEDGWQRHTLDGVVDGFDTVALTAVDSREDDRAWVTSTGWLRPSTLGVVDLSAATALATSNDDTTPERADSTDQQWRVPIEQLKSAPHRFDTDGLELTQHWATSADGTAIPYFQISRADLQLDGANPTVLYGYGGFEIALTPSYDAILGRSWLAPTDGQAGVYVVAGIRGGGEFGPGWHQAALRENRHRAYDDFAAVARHLVARGVTSVEHLGCRGGSNGGLLVGNMLTGYPNDFGAIVCQVPLLDMQRYHLLLAGASWMAEYGDPDDPQDWEFLQTYSPYHRFNPAHTHPPVFLATSTKDDRVHPGHARKLAALLAEHDRDVTYWENVEGGHGGASTPRQSATLQAMAWTFFDQRLRG